MVADRSLAASTRPLAERLQQDTSAEHQRMHALMDRLQPFASIDRYANFVAAQYLFQCDIEHLFVDPQLREWIPDLDQRGHRRAALQDLKALRRSAPDADVATRDVRSAEALGWLYVSEGSTLGAAFLLREVGRSLGLSADRGARHLAAYPEGRAIAWRRFTAALNNSGLSEHEQGLVVSGALQAFKRFGQLLEAQFATG